MDDRRAGWLIRRIRQHLRLRQVDVDAANGVSQQRISVIELGALDEVPLRTIRAVLVPLNASAELLIRWRGGDLDRVADEQHAVLVGAVAAWLVGEGWQVMHEVSYSVYGERGSIDLVAWHAQSRTLLIVEVKTELTSVEATLRKHDEKVRLSARVVRERFGWDPRSVGRLLVLPDLSTARRRVVRHDVVLGRAYPVRGDDVRRWLRSPDGPLAGIRFQSVTRGTGGRRRGSTPRRIRRRSSTSTEREERAPDRAYPPRRWLSPAPRVAEPVWRP